MVLVYIIQAIYLTFLLISGIILRVYFKKLSSRLEAQSKETQDAIGQVFGLLGALGEENVHQRKMIDSVISLIREAKSSVKDDGISLIKVRDDKGTEQWVEEDSEF